MSSLVAAFPMITEVSTIEICLCSLHRKEAFTGLRKREKIDRSPCSFTRKRRFTSRTSQAEKNQKHYVQRLFFFGSDNELLNSENELLINENLSNRNAV